MEEIVIMGGGVAGLSCLNALLDHDISPLLLEGAAIGSPKMCGEFLSPQTVTLLNQWGIDAIQTIPHANFFIHHKMFNVDFPKPAGAMARSEAEKLLAKRALSKSARIRENTLVKKIIPATANSPYIFHLHSGEEITAKTVIFATGKYAQNTYQTFPYFGIKLHFNHIVKPHTLLMCSHPGAYFGIVPISNEMSNFACLVKKEVIEKIGSCKQFMDYLISSNSHLQVCFEKRSLIDSEWFESPAPHFKLRQTPKWPNSYWIGDALGGVPPAIGSGFAHAMSSAILAADCYLHTNANDYLKKAKRQIKSKLIIGNLMHQLMLNPNGGRVAFPLLLNKMIVNLSFKKLAYL